MANTTQPAPFSLKGHILTPWTVAAGIFALVALLDLPALWPTVLFTANALLHTAPFILFAVLAVAYMKASGAENLIAKAFEGNPVRMVVFAALLGGLSPFCSCEVIPFIAALLAVGAPLGAVMAFWLASPLMDPAMFLITSSELGWDFAIAKTLAAVGLGMMGGFGTLLLARSPVFVDPLRERPAVGGCCGVQKPFSGKPVWKFWPDADRVRTFRDTALDNGIFLLKWLMLAYVFEALMLRYVPADMIAQFLGGQGAWPVIKGALIGAPAYLNGYMAVGMVDALLDQGMTQGAAMAFVVAGGVSCIPAAIAVWALVKPRVFAAYLTFAILGAMVAGGLWQWVQ
ncbi:Putative two-component membrane permease complex subunit SMU_747c [Ascidiaceihabitans donghaensis]|uniref:Two-component membrane permease complex subunit SMU_747c n=1 Tax=Ascidiaceihabitans donghaensis TaxID=1510460 RepID=A0A2R8BBK2_9RHOB|nr:permease [Ascidiaceihabitans donghaensis]SPH20286.1 Putative two-component membrane permease complex subunit SMU_747c [Ascidiaceihabitans donghaensis]